MIDLHTHSTCSDGTESPERVVDLAVSVGCRSIALTDHDGTSGHGAAAERAERAGVGFVPGCEVSCGATDLPLHLLCYFVTDDSALAPLLARLRRDRARRNAEISARLASLGVPVSAEEARAEAGGTVVGRPHFAAVLVRKNLATSIDDAFEHLLAEGAPAYVPRAPIDPAEVISAAHRSGAVVALAHPLTTRFEPAQLDRLVSSLAAEGLDGLESYYATYDPPTRDDLVALARRHELVPTGGSDFHGSYRPGVSIGVGCGDLDVPDAVLDELTARAPSA